MTTTTVWCGALERPARAAIFLSGSGSNAERILARWRNEKPATLAIVALATDRPETSRARELGRAFDLPVIEHDIRRFYRDRGQKRISIATEAGQRLRREWTDGLREQLAPLDVDFGIFAGFVPLTNLAEDFPCLNVHPGDLTYLKEGRRYLVGLHTIPIEAAILEELEDLRSSVIVVEPWSGKGEDMDSGVILGLSPPVPIDLQGHDLEELRAVAAARPERRPPGGYKDLLESIAEHNQERLKEGGDWVVFPRVVFAFAAGRFATDEAGELLYRENGAWKPVETVVFGPDWQQPVPR